MIIKEDSNFIYIREYNQNFRNIFKRLKWDLNSFFINLILKKNKIIVQKKYQVSICAIFKNEAPYIKEWINYHKIVGINHFYLYNNNSNDNYIEVLKPFIEEGLVTLINWPYNQKQIDAYKNCISNYSDSTEWLGFIDLDEFVVPKSTNTIYEFLKEYSDYGSVKIYWKVFGSSGLIDRDLSRLVSEDFTVCWNKHADVGKCFYNTAFELDTSNNKNIAIHHKTWTKFKGISIPPVNVFKKFCFTKPERVRKKEFPIQINHYITKSFNEFKIRSSKGDVYYKINPHNLEYFYKQEMHCVDTDYSIFKYLTQLKKLMYDKQQL